MNSPVRRHKEPTPFSRFRSSGSPPSPPVEETHEQQQQAGVCLKRRKLCLKSLAAAASAANKLDPTLWKFLPDDVFEKVVAYLPFPGLLRCRAVSKQCQAFVFSKRFQEARACVASWASLDERTQHLLVFATIQGRIMCTAYDALRNRWLRMPPMEGLDPRAKDCIAGDGGLLCFRDVNAHGLATLFVYNPVTSTCRSLPPLPLGLSLHHHTWLLTHMIYNRFTSSYKLLVLTQPQCQTHSHLEVYDSLTHSWSVDTTLALLQRKYKLLFAPQVGACCDNFFYFVAKEGMRHAPHAASSAVVGLVVYDLYEGVFREKLLYRCEPRCPNSHIDVQVVECQGTVYMVVREDDCGGTKGVSFCRLNPSKEQKIEDSILFESFFTKWGKVFPKYRCVSVREGLGLLLYDQSFQVLAEDLSEELQLPPCPFQGLQRFVTAAEVQKDKDKDRRKKSKGTTWPGYYATHNVVSDAQFQPNASVTV